MFICYEWGLRPTYRDSQVWNAQEDRKLRMVRDYNIIILYIISEEAPHDGKAAERQIAVYNIG